MAEKSLHFKFSIEIPLKAKLIFFLNLKIHIFCYEIYYNTTHTTFVWLCVCSFSLVRFVHLCFRFTSVSVFNYTYFKYKNTSHAQYYIDVHTYVCVSVCMYVDVCVVCLFCL